MGSLDLSKQIATRGAGNRLPPNYKQRTNRMYTTTPAKTLPEALKVISETADFYHSMHNSQDDIRSYWSSAYITALDLLERITGLVENSLITTHDVDCNCMCNACDVLVQSGGRGAGCDNCILCPEHCEHR